jgi:Uncharacterized protein conserved in bacteria
MSVWLDRQRQFKSIWKMIKAFSPRLEWRETLIFLFFILLALSFWLLQNLQQEYEIEIFIPVKYINIPDEMASAESQPQEIVAKIRDKGTVLLNYNWLRSFNPVEVDLDNIKNERSMQVTGRTIEASISKQLLSTTSLLNIEPQTLTIEYAELKNKEVSVEIDVEVLLEPGFQISGPITVKPETIMLYANSNMLDSITSVKTVYSEINKADKIMELKLRLQKIAGAQMDPEEVIVTIPVEEFTEKRITLAVMCSDMPKDYVLRTFPSSVEVVCNVPISRFRDLSDSDFEILIPFQEFEAKQTLGKLQLYLTKLPLWISPPVIIPDTIEFIIEQNSQ